MDVDGFMQYFPATNQGSVIVASRNRDVIIPDSHGIEVAPLDSETGSELLSSLLQVSDLHDPARNLVDFLGGHPLAISIAAEYMLRTAMPCSKYLQLCKEKQLEHFESSDPRIQSVFVASLALLSTDAQGLIECIALLDSDQIFEELFLQDYEGDAIVEKYVIDSSSR